jgi:hypothetical protein
MTSTRLFPSMSAAVLLTGVSLIFLAGAAPATNPQPAQAKPAPSTAAPLTPVSPAQAPAAAAVMAAPAPATPKPPLPKQLSVTIDQTSMLEIPSAVSTVSVGNPAIADVSVQGDRLFFTGKSFGRTNVLALSAAGETVIDMMVFVTSSGGGSVTVYKGNKQLTYNCAPNCDRMLMPGDASEEFDKINGQMSAKAGAAGGNRNE